MLNLSGRGIYWSIAIIAIGAFIFMMPERSLAKSPSWEFNFGLGATYDDNVLNYSDADLDQFDSTTADSSGKFGIESKSDLIISPKAEIVYKTRAFNHSFHIGLNAGYNIFAKNDIKNYGNVGLWLREYLRKGAYIQFSTAYVPDYYYRNLYAASSGYQKAHYSKLGLGLKLAMPIYRGLDGILSFGYDNRDFNTSFDERDLKANNFGFELSYQPKNSHKLWGGYEYSIARSSGRDNLLDRRDASYDSFLFWVGSRLYFGGLKNRNMNVGAAISFKNTFFQTNKLTEEDRYRFARKDDRWSITISANHELGKKASVGIQINRLDNKADLPARDLKPYLDFGSNSAKIVFDYSF